MHGQRGSMHDPLGPDEIDAKFPGPLAAGRLPEGARERLRSVASGPVRRLAPDLGRIPG